MSESRKFYGLLVAALVTLLVGCTDSTPGSAGAEAGSTEAPSGSLDPSSPPIEGSGPEKPQPPQPKQPSVNIARLPIGGSSGNSGGPAWCVQVSFLAEIPKGVSHVSVTGVDFNPEGIFTTGGDGCQNERPQCAEFSGQQSDCELSVVQVKNSDATVTLTLRGTATCVDASSCADFAKNLQPGSIGDLQAQPDAIETSSSTTTSSTDESSSISPTSEG